MGMFSQVSDAYGPEKCIHCGKVEVPGQWWHMRGHVPNNKVAARLGPQNGHVCPTCVKMLDSPAAVKNSPKKFSEFMAKALLKRANPDIE